MRREGGAHAIIATAPLPLARSQVKGRDTSAVAAMRHEAAVSSWGKAVAAIAGYSSWGKAVAAIAGYCWLPLMG